MHGEEKELPFGEVSIKRGAVEDAVGWSRKEGRERDGEAISDNGLAYV